MAMTGGKIFCLGPQVAALIELWPSILDFDIDPQLDHYRKVGNLAATSSYSIASILVPLRHMATENNESVMIDLRYEKNLEVGR